MLRFKPCPLFVFLSPEKLRFCLSCNFVAKVRIISETTKLFGNFFREICKFLSESSETASAYLNLADWRFLTHRNPTSPCASRNFNEREPPLLSIHSGGRNFPSFPLSHLGHLTFQLVRRLFKVIILLLYIL